MPRNSPELLILFEWILSVPFEWILSVPFEFSVSFELVLGIQGPVSEPKHIYWQILHCSRPLDINS